MLTKAQFEQFRRDFAFRMLPLEEIYGLSITIGNISYNETEFHTTMKCILVSDDGEPLFNEDRFNLAKGILGFKGNYGDTFIAKGETYRVTGLVTNRPKFPVQATRIRDGAKFKFGLETVNFCLTKNQVTK